MPTDVPAGVTPTYTQQYRRCGKPSCPLCAAGGRGHGPYWYAYWRENGRTRSRYLGKQSPPGAAPDGEAAPPCDRATPLPPPNAPDGGPQPPAVVVPVVRPHLEARTAAIPAPPPSGLRARTLGGFALWRSGVPLATERWERTKAGALLKWLLGVPGHRLSRDAVAEQFWPEGTPERGMANLRVLVHRLRGALGDARGGDGGCLRYDGEVLALTPGGTDGSDWLDAEAFASAARAALAGWDAAACRVALALYAGDYLPGDAYEEWAVGRRESLRQQRLAVLLHLAAFCTGSGEAEEAERCLGAVLAAEACHEPAGLALMRLHAAGGRPGQALRVYRRFAEALREDLALEPEAPMQALARVLAAQQPPAPAIALPELVRNNLPAPLTSFVGRRRELADLRALLQPAHTTGASAAGDEAPTCRLLTLTGPGGAGKTRLALRLADWLLDELGAYPDGIWLAELASLADPALVPKAVALALGVQEEATRPLSETLALHLRTKRLLLLLDNCEHLVDGCGDLVARLLPVCPALQVLATSRAALGVAGERPWPVPALSLPEAGGAAPAGHLLASEAVRLFLDRARVHRPDLTVTEMNAGAVASICRQLEGVPLALELAAARANMLGLEQIAARLGESVRLLTGGPRTAPRRQRTLRATLNWSYELLTEPEQALLQRLAVFASGCTLEAAEAVCVGEGIAAVEVLELLDGLVRQSLVQVGDAAGVARYRLLETVRHYGQERLAAGGELAAAQQRHAAYYLRLAEEADPHLLGAEQRSWMDRLEREHDNVRAALRWSLGQDNGATALSLGGMLWRFWFTRGYLSEGRQWLHDALRLQAVTTADSALARAKALNGAGALAYYQGDYAEARHRYEQALAIYHELGDRRGVAALLGNVGLVVKDQGDSARATAYYQESLAAFQELEDRRGVANALNNLGIAAGDAGDFARAAALHERSLALKRELEDARGIITSLNNLGAIALDQGNYERAMALHEESLVLARALGHRPSSIVSLGNLGRIAREQGAHDRAIELYAQCLTLCQAVGDKRGIASTLEGLGGLARLQQRSRHAAHLYGLAEAIREAIGAPRPPSEDRGAAYDRDREATRAALGDDGFARAWAEGRALSPEQALSQVVDSALAGGGRVVDDTDGPG